MKIYEPRKRIALNIEAIEDSEIREILKDVSELQKSVDGLNNGFSSQVKIAEQEDITKIWLNNAGLDGHSTFGHIILFKDYIVKLKPKIILFLVGANDVGRNEYSDNALSHIKRGIDFSSFERSFSNLSRLGRVQKAF